MIAGINLNPVIEIEPAQDASLIAISGAKSYVFCNQGERQTVFYLYLLFIYLIFLLIIIFGTPLYHSHICSLSQLKDYRTKFQHAIDKFQLLNV